MGDYGEICLIPEEALEKLKPDFNKLKRVFIHDKYESKFRKSGKQIFFIHYKGYALNVIGEFVGTSSWLSWRTLGEYLEKNHPKISKWFDKLTYRILEKDESNKEGIWSGYLYPKECKEFLKEIEKIGEKKLIEKYNKTIKGDFMISKDTILRGLGDYTEKNLETDPAEQSEHIIQKIKNILEEAVNKNQGLALGAQS